MMLKYLTLASAFVITCVAEYFSIIGLTTIFVGAFYSVVIMGISLAIGKLVATSWLYRNWYSAPLTIKYYLIAAVLVLMFITSLGTFGYLSKAHIEQKVPSGDIVYKIGVIDERIKMAKETIDSYRRDLKRMDDSVDQTLLRSSNELGAQRSEQIRRQQTQERSRILANIEAQQKIVSSLSDERAPLAASIRKIESELGPLKYITEFVYGTDSSSATEKAVMWIIILLALVLDPLAIALLLAYNHSSMISAVRTEPGSHSINLDKDSILKL